MAKNTGTEDKERDEAIRLWNEGFSAYKIGKLLERDAKTVRKLLGAHYDPKKYAQGKHGAPKRDALVPRLAEIYARYQNGETLKSMEDEFGASDAYLEELLKRHGYELKDKGWHTRSPIGPFEFVEVWQTSETIDEVVVRLKILNRNSVQMRATKYRKEGVPLKDMFPNRKLDYEELATFAELFL